MRSDGAGVDLPGLTLRTLTNLVIVGVSAIFLAVIVAGTRHQRFVFDDFEFASAADRIGLIAQSKQAFYGFSGRTLLIAGGGAATTAGYRWAAVIVAMSIIGLITGVTILMKRVLSISSPQDRLGVYASSLAAIALCLGTLPARGQVLYWIIGALVYITPMTLVVFGLCWVTWIESERSEKTPVEPKHFRPALYVRNIPTALGASLCIALGSGGNETVAAATILGLLTISALARKRSQMRRRALMMIPFALVGAAVIYGAPGQRARASWVPVHRSLDASINVASEFLSAMSTLIITNIPVLIASGLLGALVLGHQTTHGEQTLTKGRFGRPALALLVVTIATWTTLLIIASFGSMAVPPARAVTMPWCLTVFSALIGGAAIREKSSLASHLAARLSGKPLQGVQMGWLIIVIVVGGVVLPRIERADKQLGGVARRLDCVDRVLRSAARQPQTDQTTTYIDAPELVNDVWFARKDPAQWPNKRMAEYYELTKISNDPSQAPSCRQPD